jgi:hypothetical protein
MLVSGAARAGAISACNDPFAFEAAVNLYVLQDAEPRGDAVRFEEPPVRQPLPARLAWLVKLDALFHDSFGNLGVHYLWQTGYDKPCTLDSVARQVLPKLPQHGAVVFVDQRVYQESNQILLQTYVRFLRVDATHHAAVETVSLGLGANQPAFSELLPAQVVTFPPRRLTTNDLETIEHAFAAGSLLYSEPRTGSTIRPLSLTSEQPFLVTDVRSDGWMQVDTTKFGGNARGWLRADPAVGERLRSLLPELDFLEGVIGYLSYLQASDGVMLSRNAVPGIARRADGVFARFIGRANGANDHGLATALTGTLRAAMALGDSARATAILTDFVATVQQTLPDSRVRDLLGMTRLAACCRSTSPRDNPSRSAAGVIGLSGALNDFQGALAIDPNNTAALTNLGAIYAALGQLAEYPLAKEPPTSTPQALREAYAQALQRLPATRAELSTRQQEIRVLLAQVVPTPH